MKKTVHVTEEDIEGAGCGHKNNPLTRAAQRTTGQKWIVVGGKIACRVGRRVGRRICVLPYSVLVRRRIYRSLRVMQPFEFELDI